jgi:Holliday junction DNA helicase RuvA
MISYIEGKLVEKTPTNAVLDVGGVGYSIHIPVSTYEMLGEVNSNTRLLTHLSVKDDRMEIFGFSTPEEKNLFSLLISVSGIGGKTAISVLSGAKPEELKRAILSGDKKFISCIRGIGKKTAERLIVELKDKVARGERPVDEVTGVSNDALRALKFLGLKDTEAEEALKKVLNEKGRDIPVEEMVREALKRFS